MGILYSLSRAACRDEEDGYCSARDAMQKYGLRSRHIACAHVAFVSACMRKHLIRARAILFFILHQIYEDSNLTHSHWGRPPRGHPPPPWSPGPSAEVPGRGGAACTALGHRGVGYIGWGYRLMWGQIKILCKAPKDYTKLPNHYTKT